MARPRELAQRFEAYSDWRRRLSVRIEALHAWLSEEDLANAETNLKVAQIVERLHEDQLVVAFVAEFSRGKSELINAIFFADFGQRLLPSSAGRTTMCPTELLYDVSRLPSIRLLPIETRLKESSVTELKAYADEWVDIPLDLSSAERMGAALARVSEVKRVAVTVARELGLHDEAESAGFITSDGQADIPVWRHAIINFPHPLLKQGLVVFDTPGLNAIGAEPELTLSLLPNAHAVLFILAADAGVTKSDLDVWNKHLAGAEQDRNAGRLVVLNKIDGLWDELKAPEAVDAEIARQMRGAATILGVPEAQVFGVSAQKGLVARVNGDDALLARSRLPALEAALSDELIPAKREIVGAATRAEIRALAASVRATLEGRESGIAEELAELRALRGKNADVVGHMVERVRQEKEVFDRGLQRFTALRNVLTAQTNALFDHIGMEALRANAGRTRREIESSPFTRGMRSAMNAFFTAIRGDFDQASTKSADLHELMQAMYAQFAKEYGLERLSPPPFSMLRYQKEIDRLERAYNTQFNTLWNMVSHAKFSLMKRFFETIASRVRHVYKVANRDLESWVRAVMSPLETQVREHRVLLQRRLDGLKRIYRASDELEGRLAELEEADEALVGQLGGLARELEAIEALLEPEALLPLAANF
ncbi:MAG: dynamin family protein [Casimicrobiaceae bacterium]